ncbi:hypothetical protein IWZ01DRAFT_516760 [Phyllosticta capitalensis]
MPPPVTPSPHRFRPPRDTRTSHKAPPSSLRREAPPSSPHTPASVAPRNDVPSSQFKPTPRFSASLRRSGHGADVTSTQSRNVPSASQQFAPRFNRKDSIEDSFPQDGESEEKGDQDDEMLFDSESQAVVESVEPRFTPAQDNAYTQPFRSDADFGDDHPSKRRRLSPQWAEAVQTSNIGTAEWEHTTPRRPPHRDLGGNPDPTPMNPPTALPNLKSPPRTAARPSRFKPSTAASEREYSVEPTVTDASAPPSTSTTTLSRPRNPFRLPPTSRQSASTSAPDGNAAAETPLPEAFSPHRRNQKFVPGGMAETLRGWILGVGHGHCGNFSAQKSQSSRFVVAAGAEAVGANANRWRLLAGVAAGGEDGLGQGEEVRALLVGQGQGSVQRAALGEGDEVRVVAPSWDVEVARGSGGSGDKQRWVVGVDWRRADE